MDARLKKGDSCPDFSLQDQDGKIHKPEDYRGKYLLIYFYPKAMTPGCTTQSCAVSGAVEDFSNLNCAAVGISPDDREKQKKFEQKNFLKIPLLCDTEHTAAEAFGVWGEKSMFGNKYFGIIRSSFLIGPDGKVIESWYKVKPGETVPKAVNALEEDVDGA